ncbi:MAG: beta-galactosidase [Gammaproteobacteria bacterium]|nr:beta-galactosidase [Gammaproteobacteria bacterium]
MTFAEKTRRLGVCYYPEHWPREWWADDAARMIAMGITQVRVGEFAWSRIEPESGRFDWTWLDEAIDVLDRAGLAIVLCTPTATPPKWLVDAMPDMIAIDAVGKPRRFGSRRHYCFSHEGYRRESRRITRAVAERYGRHRAVVAWQTDNEYGCHDTVLSWSPAALAAFRRWLSERYVDIDALNAAWGNVFWSMEYRSFDEIDLPNLTVTEANPAHVLDFRRFSSWQVKEFNREQCLILRESSPGRDLTHNFMGFVTDFDHHDLAEDLDVAAWDSYPLGFLEQFWFGDDDKHRYARQGHPDVSAFHHDLYRGVGRGRWWVMEQQPGPVNWARYNPAPLPGMVRLWSLEAFAHGAEVVSYFRWRQAPFAQEQMHAGLLRPDRVDDVAALEVRETAAALSHFAVDSSTKAEVALIFDYQAEWMTAIQPQGAGFSALRVCFEWYSALRQLGLDIDILPPAAELSGYRMIVVPCLPVIPDTLVDKLRAVEAMVIYGPRTGSKTGQFSIPRNLPPGELQSLLPIKVVRVESLREGLVEPGADFSVSRWFEHVESALPPELRLHDGRGVLFRQGSHRYLAGMVDPGTLHKIFRQMASEVGVGIRDMPEGVRTRRFGKLRFVFNHCAESRSIDALLPKDAALLVGMRELDAAGVAAWIDDGIRK